ncbi:filamentous hemagglutinin N-terminal domain-containing protein [Leptolyngbya sp. FACHB-671]|nr:filamentous hemagglutinin N-terminal domain-containing protein [Leptolyngbya sp. FACHB-671]
MLVVIHIITLEKAILMRRFGWQTAIVNGIVLSTIVLGWTTVAVAQRRPIADNTLGVESSTVIPLDPQSSSDRIEGGAQRGNNLFHSFREFHVDEGRSVYFADPGVDNILARVTGGGQSQILGVLGVLGDANLFLLNPSGILFGDDARLDVRGSFVATTANAIAFPNGDVFSATNATAPTPLLNVNPNALLFNQLNPQPIINRSIADTTGLTTAPGQSLALVGGDVRLENGRLTALGGRVELGGLSEPGTIGLTMNGNSPSLEFPTNVARSNVSLANNSQINVAASDGGSVVVTARNLSLSNSSILAGIAAGLGGVDSQAGDVDLNATGSIALVDSEISNQVEFESTGQGGSIRITTGSLSLTNDAQLNTRTDGEGDAGDIIIDARDTVSFDGAGVFFVSNGASSVVGGDGIGQGGNIRITTGSLSLTNGALLDSRTFGQGDAGDITIDARDTVSFDGPGDRFFPNGAFSLVGAAAIGRGGNIRITTGSLSVTNGAALGADTAGEGDAGDIIIDARDTVSFDGTSDFRFSSGASSEVREFGIGRGGNIRITTGSLFLTNDAQLSTRTNGEGDAGDIIIDARDTVSFNGAGVLLFPRGALSEVGEDGIGRGGNIRITTGTLSVTSGALLSASTAGEGDAGDIIIDARDTASFDGTSDDGRFSSGVFSAVRESGIGRGGNIRITTGSLFLTNSALLDTTTFGRGDAGNVTINAGDRATFNGSSIVSSVGSGAVGNGGNIRITTGLLSLTNRTAFGAETRGQGDAGNIIFNTSALSLNEAQLQVLTFGRGNAGNVVFNVRDRASLSDSAIFSSVRPNAAGDGGDIRITTGSLSLTNSELDAETGGQGDAGSVITDVGDRATFDNSSIFSSVRPGAVGDGGDIRLRAGSLFLTNEAQFAASTAGRGNAGNVTIRARDRMSLNNSAILSSVNPDRVSTEAVGTGGNIRITIGSLLLTNRSQLAADTAGQGNAGNVIVEARDRVSLNNSAILSSVNPGAVGDGRNIEITASSLSLTEGARLTASTAGQGDAGNVIIAGDRVSLEGSRRQGSRLFGSGIFTTTEAGARGSGGNVRIATDAVRIADGASISTETENAFSGGTVSFNANTFEAIDGGQVITSTGGSGQAGSITLNAGDQITLSGASPFNISGNQGTASGLFANTAPNSAGQGGIVQLRTGQLQVFDRARIAVDSQGNGIAGGIDITAAGVQLDNQARLTAETAATNGGNITLRDVGVLLLRNGSLISTTAGTERAGGDGGNIAIDADFIVAVPNENSDIRANAFSGSGGNVRITTEGLFGIAPQPRDNPLTNDITASSELGVQGTVDITPPDVDLRRGLPELPAEVVDASDQIAQTCSGAGVGQRESEFIVTGRGGLPTAPTDSLVGEESLTGWSTLDEPETAVTSQIPEGAIAPPNQATDRAGAIVEAQEWIVENGTVRLIVAAPAHMVQPSLCNQTENP